MWTLLPTACLAVLSILWQKVRREDKPGAVNWVDEDAEIFPHGNVERT